MKVTSVGEAHPYSQRTLPRMLVAQGERHRDRPLLTIGASTWTFRDAASVAARRAHTLAAAGIGPGDRVALLLANRLKDAIRRRGENISSYEVEQALLSHPNIETAAVFPVRSELAEDEVMAAIVLKADARLDPIELMQFCEPRLPYFTIPRFIEFLAELPRTENGKVQMFKLRERGRGDRTWDREAAGYVVRRR